MSFFIVLKTIYLQGVESRCVWYTIGFTANWLFVFTPSLRFHSCAALKVQPYADLKQTNRPVTPQRHVIYEGPSFEPDPCEALCTFQSFVVVRLSSA